MQLLLAVIEDLGSFAIGAVRGFFLASPKIEVPERIFRGPDEYPALSAPESLGARALIERISVLPAIETTKSLQKSTVMYTSSVVTPLRSEPGVFGDTVYALLPYGSLVMVLEVRDMWARVASGVHTGWVYVDDLEDRAAHVYPTFHLEEMNGPEDPATIRVRALLNDEFGAGEMQLPLQPEEYVLYRLMRRGVRVEWPPIRPRTPGLWNDILRGTTSVESSDIPSIGAVMEYVIPGEQIEKDRGHLAYVEAVFPDNSIQISEVGWPQTGVYNERVLVAEEWRKENPSFLLFS